MPAFSRWTFTGITCFVCFAMISTMLLFFCLYIMWYPANAVFIWYSVASGLQFAYTSCTNFCISLRAFFAHSSCLRARPWVAAITLHPLHPHHPTGAAHGLGPGLGLMHEVCTRIIYIYIYIVRQLLSVCKLNYHGGPHEHWPNICIHVHAYAIHRHFLINWETPGGTTRRFVLIKKRLGVLQGVS